METPRHEGRFHAHPAHPPAVHLHNRPTILFVTICVYPRRSLLDSAWAQEALIVAWRHATHWMTGEFMIMPDHVHFFCKPGVWEHPPIRRWAGFWKRTTGDIEPRLRGIFQEDCWDTQMRSIEHFEEKLHYVRENPVRKGLVERWGDWPYRGKVFDVGWV